MKRFFHKCLISLGLVLLLALLIPNTSVSAADADYRLITKSITLVKGKSFALKIYNLENAKATFKSDDPEIASVTEDGIIIANKVGSTVVTATIKDSSGVTSLTCDVMVGPPAVSVKITKSRIVIGIDEAKFLNVILKPSNTFESAKFSSYDPSIVSVSPGGRITGKKFGLTYVFAQIEAVDLFGNRKYDSCTVIVTAPEDVSLLTDYFNAHPELDLISDAELTKALDEFFNDSKNVSSGTSLTENLNRCLEDKFDLAKLRKIREDSLSKI